MFKFDTSTIPRTALVINIASGKIIDPGSNSSSITRILLFLQTSRTKLLVIPLRAPVSIEGVKTFVPLIQKKFPEVDSTTMFFSFIKRESSKLLSFAALLSIELRR